MHINLNINLSKVLMGNKEYLMTTFAKVLSFICCNFMLIHVTNAQSMTSDQMLAFGSTMIYKQPVVNTTKTTYWFAEPYAILSENLKTKQPEVIMVAVESKGYRGFFDQTIQLNCIKPSQSFIMTKNHVNNMSLIEAMDIKEDPDSEKFEYRIDKKVVETIFAKFCE